MLNSRKDILVVGLALFSMFFGAGNLIFPPYLGFQSAAEWGPGMVGFILTGVGLPLLGVYATLKSGGNIMTLGRPLGRIPAATIGIIIILSIGPLYAIPRTAATVHEVGIKTFFPQAPPWITAVVFFGIVIVVCLNNLRVVDRLGKFLTPFLLLTLLAILVAGIINPLSELTASPETAFTFATGFTEGYQTMDALAATMFAGVVMTHVISLGYKTTDEQLYVALRAGFIGIILLALVYAGLGYLGATAYGMFPEDVERTALLVGIARNILGSSGAYLLAAAITLACLTTAIGLTTTCGEYFQGLTDGKLPYRTVAIVTAVFSGFISIIGVDTMVNIAVPFLVLMYPVLMVLVLFTCFDRIIPNDMAYWGGIIGALALSLISAFGALYDVMEKYGVPTGWLEHLQAFQSSLPLSEFGLEWMIPTVVLAIIFSFFGRGKSKNKYLD